MRPPRVAIISPGAARDKMRRRLSYTWECPGHQQLGYPTAAVEGPERHGTPRPYAFPLLDAIDGWPVLERRLAKIGWENIDGTLAASQSRGGISGD